MSPWYQETPKDVLGCWMTNRSNSLFLGMWPRVTSITSTGPKEFMVTLAWALGSRQSALRAAPERTILKEVLLAAKAVPAASSATIKAAPRTSDTRRVLLLMP